MTIEQTPEATADDIEFIRIPEVRQMTALGTTKIYELVRNGLFPPQVSLGGTTVAWVKSEVQEWCRDRIAQARQHMNQSEAA